MPIVWIVVPVMVFLVLSGIFGRVLTDRHRWRLFGIAGLAAALTGAATLFPLAHPGHWQDHLQFAWIGVHGESGNPLTIGGAATETENIGWPGNFRFPQVRLTPGTGDMLEIETSSHSGFVRRDSDLKILNGQLVAEGGNAVTTFTEDGVEHHFQFEFRPCYSRWTFRGVMEFWAEIPSCLSIYLDGGKDSLTQAEEGRFGFRPIGKERAEFVSGFVEQAVRRMRQEGANHYERDKKAAQAGLLERWAASVEFSARESKAGKELYFLAFDPGHEGTEDRFSNDQIASGSEITILWPRNKLSMAVKKNPSNKIDIAFDAPYRHSTPLPPGKPELGINDKKTLALKRTLAPGDIAFLLPFPARDGFDEKPVDAIEKSVIQRKIQIPILHETSVPYRGFDLIFKSIDAVPRADRLSLSGNRATLLDVMALGLLTLLGGLACLFASRLPIDRKAMYGSVVLATWGIVCIRFLLAFRFSFDPAQMDKYSAQQMYSGVHALILIPGAVALCCLFATARVRSAWMIRALVVSSAVLLVTLGHWFARHLWVELPNSIIAADRNEFVAPALIVGLVIAMVRSGKAPRAGNNGQESLFALFFQWETHNRFRLLKEIGVIILWIFIALVAGRIASHFPWPPVRSFTKEVLLAAMQCGTVWYALRGIDTKNSAAFASRTFCRWCIVFFIVSSISLDDVGGIMAGWSFLISLAVIALVAHFQKGKRYRFKWTREFSIAVIPIVIIGLAGMAGWAACQTTWLDKGKEFVDTPATQRIFHWLDANDKDVQAQEIAEKYYRASGRSNEQELSETDEQTWQNQAMIVLGGWRGVGFGNAPVHRSAIPQHTLQADSTYSFFIGSEYGRRGGIALILLFAFPLIAVIKGSWKTGLRNAPERMAAIIMAAFFLEMLTHVLMNMEVLPMTGRNMPMLSTQSPANTVRWVALLCFACVCWARSGPPEPPRPALRLARWFSLEEASALLIIGLMVLVLALRMGAWTRAVEETAFASTGRLSPEEKERFKTLSEAERSKGALIFSRSAYMNEARLYITRQAGEEPVLRIERDRDGNPWLHNDDGQLKLDDFKHTKLAEEAQRFNGLPLSRRLPAEPSADECSHVAPQEQEGCLLRSKGACVGKSHGDKHAYMRCLFNREIAYRKTHQAGRPSLFELTHELFADIDQQYENTAPPETDINPAFQNVIDFALYDMSQLPSVVFSNPDGGGVGWRISMAGSQFTVTGSRERRHETAAFQARDGHLTPRLGQARFAGSVDIALTNCSHPNPTRRPKGTPGTEVVVTLDVDEEGRLWGQPHMKVASTSHGRRERTGRMEFTDGEGYETATNACGLAEKPAWSVERMRNPNELIGKAWENGEWKLTWRRTPNIPWVSTLAHALPNPAIQKELPGANAFHEYRLTLDPVLQDSAGKFLDGLAAAKYFDAGTRKLIPFRAGIAVLDMSNGDVLASVGWPHLSGDDVPRLDASTAGVLEPAEEWISTEAPASLRIRFMGDHNLEALPVGSASKPMWAAAALSVNPALAQMRTRKTAEDEGQEKEAQLFGVDVKPGWVLENRGKDEKACCGLDEYLAYSDNRFQTRLNFSALAEQQQPRGKMKLMTAGPPESRPPHESFDGGRTWGGIPDLSRLGFRPRDLKGGDWETRLDEGPNGYRLADADLARNMHNFYPVEVESTSPVYHSLSFWTGRNQDDGNIDVFAAVMGGISPQQTNLALDNVKTARDLVTILLGGGTNRWSNIELASGFYTALTGNLLVPHIVSMQDKTDPTPRNPLPNDLRGKLERGLNGVVTWPGATATDKMKDAVNAYRKQGGFELYAKTGTLAEANPKTGETRYWSRILLAITPHQMGDRKAPWSGLLIAVYVGDADMGTASKWANDFLVGDARQEIEFLLGRGRSRLRDLAQR